MIWSFDIFDTVLTRHTLRAADLHLLVGQSLEAAGLWNDGAVAWRSTREGAERQARSTAPGEEISLDDIGSILAAQYGAELAARALQAELKQELAAVSGIGTTLAHLARLQAKGEQICYTSDMYLPPSQILAMLAVVGAPPAPLFLSCELGKTKRTGTLFAAVAAHFNAPLNAICHLGDHAHADFAVPRRLGMKATLFTESRPSELEERVYQCLAKPAPVLASTLAGAMRARRLTAEPGDAPSLAALGSQEGALVHCAFVLWLLDQLSALGPHGVAFLARDGYLPARLYEVLRPSLLPAAPAGQYVYASRQSLHLPGLSAEIDSEDLAWIMAPAQGLTFGEWLFRLGISLPDLDQVECGAVRLPPIGEPFGNCHGVCQALLQNDAFRDLARAKASAARAVAADYLARRIAPEYGTCALVDIGWNGRMQRSVMHVLAPPESTRACLHGFYLGILRTPEGSYGNYKAWLFDLRTEPQPYCASHFQLYETIFAAPHPTTFGYRYDTEGGPEPLMATHDPMANSWTELEAFQENILAVGALLRLDAGELARAEAPLRALCRSALACLFRAPRRDQALAFAGIGFSSDQANVAKEQLVYRLNWLQQYRSVFGRKVQRSKNHWHEGQLALADAPLVYRMYRFRAVLRLVLRGELNGRDVLRKIKYRLSARSRSSL